MLRRTIVLLGVIAFTAAGVPATANAGQASVAWLAVSSTHPLTVKGHRFQPRERVRVVVRRSSGESVTRRTRASRTGTFTVAFPNAARRVCGRVTVVATGRRGSRATLRGVMQPHCIVY